MKPRVVLYNRPARDQTYEDGSLDMRAVPSTYPTGVWL